MANKVNHFRVYRNWMRVFDNMNHEQMGRVFSALMVYAFNGIDLVDGREDSYEPEERAAFYALAASIDVAAEKYGSTTSK